MTGFKIFVSRQSVRQSLWALRIKRGLHPHRPRGWPPGNPPFCTPSGAAAGQGDGEGKAVKIRRRHAATPPGRRSRGRNQS